MSYRSSKYILIIQTAFLGDTILMSHFAHSIKLLNPDANVHVVVRKGNESLVEGLDFIDKVWIWNKKKAKIKNLLALSLRLREIKWEEIYNIHRHFSSGLMMLIQRSSKKIGFKQNPLSFVYTRKVNHEIPMMKGEQALHEIDRNLLLLEKDKREKVKNFKEYQRKPFLPIKDVKIDESGDQNYLVIAPSSVWFTKQWSKKKYKELIKKLKTYKIYLIGGPDDLSLLNEIKSDQEHVEIFAGKYNLLESAKLMEKARWVIVNDSAPLHLASAVNANTIAIFCSTIPEFGYTPLSENYKIFESQKRLDCRPCGLHGHKACPLGHFECSENINVNEIVRLINA